MNHFFHGINQKTPVCLKLISWSLSVPLLAFLISCQSVDLKKVNDLTIGSLPLDNKTIVAGLKQALEISVENSIKKIGQKGGFSDNTLIKISTPEALEKVTNTLNELGLGHYVKQFELQMNRAAESTSAESQKVLLSSISQMTLTDGVNILNGSDEAATNFFKRTSSNQLAKKIKPIIASSMSKIGFYNDYKTLLKTYNAIPFTSKPNLSIEDYMVSKTLEGIFVSIAKEEKIIRENPSARVTDLLQRVFSN